MNSLFPEQQTSINFSSTKKENIGGNKLFYHIGYDIGVIHRYDGKDYSGYEFLSINGLKYFISTIKTKYPQNYDAAFLIDSHKYPKPSLDTLCYCEKKLLYAKVPDSSRIVDSWNTAFRYKQEKKNSDGEIIEYGLRPPQIGALHAILAHWSISKKPALVVMPTGTGKTETMLCLTLAGQGNHILVIVPTDSLRTQIASKFINLGILKNPQFGITTPSALCPKVALLTTSIKDAQEANQIFAANVIITTPQILSNSIKNSIELGKKIIDWCNYLIMDEAHHSPAQTWGEIKRRFQNADKPILLFTATPFRNDGSRILGDIIYNYPLSLAQRDDYYKEITFKPILEFNEKFADIKIAEKAIACLKEDIEKGYDHILMARVDEKEKAEAIFENIYKKYTEFNPVYIHSGISSGTKKQILERIKSKEHKIIVCVDMLGEGFDLPQLKICALHDLHKNITTSFQFFGRFTRTSSMNLGNATIIANIADQKLKGVLKQLYSWDTDWDKIISKTNENIIESVVKEENFFKNFADVPIPDKIPLRNITPAMSTVVYKIYDTTISWQPEKYISYFKNKIFETVPVVHKEKHLQVIIVKRTEGVKWGKIKDLINNEYELYIAYLNPTQKLLYINSTNNGSTHNGLAEALVGKNISLFNEANIYRSLSGIFQLELFNLGLKSHLNGPISFTMYAGHGIVKGLDDLSTKTMFSSNLFGVGYENGDKVTIGCSSKGRVWTKLVKTIPDFCSWCDKMGEKLLDESIDTKDLFKFIQKPEQISQIPDNKTPIAIKWDEQLYIYPQLAFGDTVPLIDLEIELKAFTKSTIDFIIKTVHSESIYQLILDENKNGRGFKYSLIEGRPVIIEYLKDKKEITELFYDHPPIVWFQDNSKMYNDLYFAFNYNIPIFNTDKILPLNWDGIDITKESQRKSKRADSIQYRMIHKLLSDADYKIIFDDDSANEASDIIAIKYFESTQNRIIVELYHCKYSSKNAAGGRLKDLYEVCGQAQRSYHWRHNALELLNHMIRREKLRKNNDLPSRFEKGGNEEMYMAINMLSSGYCETEFNIYVVQPGISKADIIKESEHLKLFGATDLLLKKTGNEFYVISNS